MTAAANFGRTCYDKAAEAMTPSPETVAQASAVLGYFKTLFTGASSEEDASCKQTQQKDSTEVEVQAASQEDGENHPILATAAVVLRPLSNLVFATTAFTLYKLCDFSEATIKFCARSWGEGKTRGGVTALAAGVSLTCALAYCPLWAGGYTADRLKEWVPDITWWTAAVLAPFLAHHLASAVQAGASWVWNSGLPFARDGIVAAADAVHTAFTGPDQA